MDSGCHGSRARAASVNVFRFWSSVVEPLLTATSPAVIVEVGAQGGRNTHQLVEFARLQHSVVHVIDPAPEFDVTDLSRRYGPHFVPHVGRSLDVLGEIPRPDAVLIDGDHNWYTVSGELRLLAERCKRDGQAFPLTLLHDIAWPYGRRDLYYDPQAIPAAHRQPYKLAGLLPDRSATVSEGGINGHLHNADQEGGPHNGVLTAIEDTLPELPGPIIFITVPGEHGLGILVPEERMCGSQPLRECVEWLQSADFLRERAEWLETQRLQGVVRVRDLESRLEEARARQAERHGEHPADSHGRGDPARGLAEPSSHRQLFAEQLSRQAEDLAAADAFRQEATAKIQKLEATVLGRDEQLRLSGQRAQQLEDARDEAVRAQEAAELELAAARTELRGAIEAREAGADELRRRHEALADHVRLSEELEGRLAEVRREVRESEDRWEDERTRLKYQLERAEETHNRELGALQRELDSARRGKAWAAEEADAANRQLTLLQGRERELARYAKQLEAQLGDSDQLAQETQRHLASAELRQRAREHETASEVERLGRSIDQLRSELDHSERAARLAGQRARSTEDELRAQIAGARAQAVLSEQTLHTVKQEIDRARASRAWRFGHWVMQTLRLLSFRPSRGTDALEKASGRVAAVLSLGDAAQSTGETPSLVGRPKAALPPGDVPVSSNGSPADRVGTPNA